MEELALALAEPPVALAEPPVALAEPPVALAIYKMFRIPGRGQTVELYNEGLKAIELAPNKVYTEWSTARKFKMKVYVLRDSLGDYSDVYKVTEYDDDDDDGDCGDNAAHVYKVEELLNLHENNVCEKDMFNHFNEPVAESFLLSSNEKKLRGLAGFINRLIDDYEDD